MSRPQGTGETNSRHTHTRGAHDAWKRRSCGIRHCHIGNAHIAQPRPLRPAAIKQRVRSPRLRLPAFLASPTLTGTMQRARLRHDTHAGRSLSPPSVCPSTDEMERRDPFTHHPGSPPSKRAATTPPGSADPGGKCGRLDGHLDPRMKS